MINQLNSVRMEGRRSERGPKPNTSRTTTTTESAAQEPTNSPPPSSNTRPDAHDRDRHHLLPPPAAGAASPMPLQKVSALAHNSMAILTANRLFLNETVETNISII